MKRLSDHHLLTSAATEAMNELLAGKVCVPGEDVIQELGRAGLAYRLDFRGRKRRIVLTAEGARYLR